VQRLVADGALADNWIHCLLRRLNFLKVSCKIFHHSLRIIDQTIVSVKITINISFVDVRNFEIMPNKLNIQPAISIMSPFAKGEHADVEEPGHTGNQEKDGPIIVAGNSEAQRHGCIAGKEKLDAHDPVEGKTIGL